MLFWEFILLMFAMAGMTMILVHGKILDVPRDTLSKKYTFFRNMIKCSMCSGFWVGFYGLLLLWLHAISPVLFYFFTLPLASSCFSFIVERLVVLVDDHIVMIEDEMDDSEEDENE